MSNPDHGVELEAEALNLFLASLEQPEDERAAWIQRETVARPELQAAVEALARADALAEGYLESGPVLLQKDRTGERVGRFELLAELGQGGMGTVYRGRRADGTFEQSVAVKLFRAELLNDSARLRFDAERQILASLEHPGIARLIDGGMTDDGTPFVVMELIEGVSITEYCDREALDLRSRLQLFQRVCDALAQAHQKGIVHRDIKPSNVLVTQDGRPKLIDFGIAKVLEDAELESTTPETQFGLLALTPEYASPEQVQAQSQSPASDVYALGILLYELLTGDRPYRTAGQTPAEIERTVCETIPPDPSTRVAQRNVSASNGLADARKLKSMLRGDLDRIVMTALRKSPAQRFVSAADFAQEIDRYLNGLPVRARGASRLYRASKFIQRNRGVVAVTALAFVALSVALVVVLLQATEAQQQRDRAREQAAAAESAANFLTEMISRSDPFANAESATLANAMLQAIPTMETRFEGQPVLEADMRYAIGYALQNLGETEPARAQFDRALVLRQQHGTPLDVAEALSGLALVDWWDGEYESGHRQHEAALELIQNNAANASSQRALRVQFNILSNWSAMLTESGQHTESIQRAEQGLALAEGLEFISDESRANIWGNIATAQESNGDFEQARTAFENTLRLLESSVGILHPSYAIALNNFSFLYFAQQDYASAIDLLEQSVEIRRGTLGESHPQTATALSNLAGVQTRAGLFDEAESNGLEALRVAEQGYASGHWRIGKAHQALARLYAMTEQFEPAVIHAQAALAIYRQSEGDFEDEFTEMTGILTRAADAE